MAPVKGDVDRWAVEATGNGENNKKYDVECLKWCLRVIFLWISKTKPIAQEGNLFVSKKISIVRHLHLFCFEGSVALWPNKLFRAVWPRKLSRSGWASSSRLKCPGGQRSGFRWGIAAEFARCFGFYKNMKGLQKAAVDIGILEMFRGFKFR